MSDTSNALLQQAYTHIENDELETAQEILAPLLQDDANNAHLWWVYAHAVRDAAIGQAALERVLELDPQYPGARELKADVLEAQSKDPDLIAFEAGESSSAGAATPLDIVDWEDLQPAVETSAGGSSSRGRLLLALALLIVIAGGAVVISGSVDLNQLLSFVLPSPEPTLEPRVIVVLDSASEPTGANIESADAASTSVESVGVAAPPESEQSDLPATASATAQDATALETAQPTAAAYVKPDATINPDSAGIASFVGSVAEQIGDFPIVPLKSGTLPTRLGNTLVIVVCAVSGAEFNAHLNAVLTIVVDLVKDLPADIEAVAAGLMDCDEEQAPSRIIGVERETLEAFASEEMNAKEFERAWQLLS